MAETHLKVDILSVRSLEDLKKNLQSYIDSIDERVKAFVEDLLESGITVAKAEAENASHQMGQYITFEKKITYADGTVTGLLIAKGETLVSQWWRTDSNGKPQEVNGSINALLATEFGTAAYALPPNRGENSQYGHSEETEWYFARGHVGDKLTDWQHATAIKPTRPMHNAFIAMEQEIENAARRHF